MPLQLFQNSVQQNLSMECYLVVSSALERQLLAARVRKLHCFMSCSHLLVMKKLFFLATIVVNHFRLFCTILCMQMNCTVYLIIVCQSLVLLLLQLHGRKGFGAYIEASAPAVLSLYWLFTPQLYVNTGTCMHGLVSRHHRPLQISNGFCKSSTTDTHVDELIVCSIWYIYAKVPVIYPGDEPSLVFSVTLGHYQSRSHISRSPYLECHGYSLSNLV